jgi:hypothetical protein
LAGCSGYINHCCRKLGKIKMLKIKATCETENCSQKGITHEFVSDVIQTVCGLCSIEITNIITEEIEDGTAETA